MAIADVVQGTGFVALRKAAGIDNPRPLLERIGTYLVSVHQKAFEKQGRVEAWPARMQPNIPGIIRDLSVGSTIKARRGAGRPVLIDTNHMRLTFGFMVAGDTVILTNKAPYVEQHQKGLTSVLTIPDQVRANLSILWRRAKRMGKGAARDGVFPVGITWKDVGWMFRAKSVTIRTRQRTVMAFTDEDQAAVADIVRAYAAEQLRG